ncbi:hypothetical protein [Brachybacterium phenoliresistens]|uniref:hypothetical protein n=1 Tax=Brachybacterium phenoliresistens TaxID=396014 RepID=UPI0031DE8B14
MTIEGVRRTLDQVRRENEGKFGVGAEARAYAEEIGGELCAACGAVFVVNPQYLDGGHQCLDDGTADIYLLDELHT